MAFGYRSIDGLDLLQRRRPYKVSLHELPAAESRVLVIRGNREIVDVHHLHKFLCRNLEFKTQDVYVKDVNAEERTIEWVFCSYPPEAGKARACLMKEYPQLMVSFGVDPMAVTLAERPGTGATLTVVPL
ncbi:hypothetical protein B0T09DRAFT_258943 [Sordaria sp. MPI-SDFR-AT-0083]|nr:hypothetical protein B0T09DRAFT_258943 [Sordaria sp. MPI-SDFR-AT-0083]